MSNLKATAEHKTVSFNWSTVDVLAVRPELTAEEANKVLDSVYKNHDASVGVNWQVLTTTADNLYPESGYGTVNAQTGCFKFNLATGDVCHLELRWSEITRAGFFLDRFDTRTPEHLKKVRRFDIAEYLTYYPNADAGGDAPYLDIGHWHERQEEGTGELVYQPPQRRAEPAADPDEHQPKP